MRSRRRRTRRPFDEDRPVLEHESSRNAVHERRPRQPSPPGPFPSPDLGSDHAEQPGQLLLQADASILWTLPFISRLHRFQPDPL